MRCARYLSEVMTPAGRVAAHWKCVNAIRGASLGKLDAVAIRGVSGALVGPTVAETLNLGLCIVRKDTAHSRYRVEGPRDVTNYVIIDDLVSTGDTVRAIQAEVSRTYGGSRAVAVVLYNEADIRYGPPSVRWRDGVGRQRIPILYANPQT